MNTYNTKCCLDGVPGESLQECIAKDVGEVTFDNVHLCSASKLLMASFQHSFIFVKQMTSSPWRATVGWVSKDNDTVGLHIINEFWCGMYSVTINQHHLNLTACIHFCFSVNILFISI